MIQANVKPDVDVCTREEISKLPECLQEYCRDVGLEGTKKIMAYRVYFHDVDFVFDEKKDVRLSMDYDMWAFLNQPYRQAFCRASMYGNPFQGIDYLAKDAFDDTRDKTKSQGGMKGYLGKAIQIFDEPVKNIDEAALITIMGEGCALNPSVLLSTYIAYEELGDNEARATFSYKDVKGSGVFSYDSDKKIIHFFSEDRQPMEEIDGKKVKVGWRCEGSELEKCGELNLFRHTKAIKCYPDREVVYFDADKYDVSYY